VNARTPAQQAAAQLRAYGPAERVTFVRGLPCAACGRYGSVNAHLLGNDGLSRKGHYTTIGPLCPEDHTLYDEHRWDFEVKYPTFDPVTVAATTERAWLAYSAARNWSF
jgi:hypothetical protein